MPHDTRHGLLVGVDDSPAALTAVEWAAREAAMRGLPLTLVHVVDEPPVATGSPARDVDAHRVLRQARRMAEESKGVGSPLVVVTHVVEGGVVPACVVLSRHADMIVVGCRGRGPISRRLLGSVSGGLVHQAHCPVAVVHDEPLLIRELGAAPVVVGIDGTAASAYATEIAFGAAARRAVPLIAVHAWNSTLGEELPELRWLQLHDDAVQVLVDWLTPWRRRFPQVEVRRVVVRDAAERHLIEQSSAAQLTVVGSRRRAVITGTMLGSVGATVAAGARTPVIVARQN